MARWKRWRKRWSAKRRWLSLLDGLDMRIQLVARIGLRSMSVAKAQAAVDVVHRYKKHEQALERIGRREGWI